jgi:AcrR family transcriptional regulator
MQRREAAPKQVRGERLVTKVLEATLAELARVGLDNLSIEDVATRAAVNKTTIYRRWPNTAELVRAALLRVADETMAVPDKGRLRADLSDFIGRFRVLIASPDTFALLRMHLGGTLRGELAALAFSIQEQKDRQIKVMLERAVARGELPGDTDIDLLYEALVGALLNLVVFRPYPASVARLELVVDLILVGAQNGGGHKALNGDHRGHAVRRGARPRTRRRAGADDLNESPADRKNK